MAYTKQTWVDGTTPIDAEHLNHIEDGIKNNSIHSIHLVKEYYHESFIIDDTVDEIREAVANDIPVYVSYDTEWITVGDYQCRGTQYGHVTFVGKAEVASDEYDVVIVHWETISDDEDDFHNELYLYGGQYNILTRVEAF